MLFFRWVNWANLTNHGFNLGGSVQVLDPTVKFPLFWAPPSPDLWWARLTFGLWPILTALPYEVVL